MSNYFTSESIIPLNAWLIYRREPAKDNMKKQKKIKKIPVIKQPDFQQALEYLINKYGIDNEMNTPDFILAEYLYDCLMAYKQAKDKLSEWNKPYTATYDQKPKTND